MLEDDAESLYGKIIELGKEMILDNLPLIEQGKNKRIPQDAKKFVENWPKRTPEDGKIDWNKSARKIHALIRASTRPYPGAFTFFKNRKLCIWKSEISDEKSSGEGKIMDINANGVKIGTGEGVMILTKIGFEYNHEELASNVIKNNDLGEILK